jgi:long-subunit fatty acid transport protein
MPRGAEPASRAGARVASADSPHALWYNPAGLVRSKRQLLGDFTLPIIQTEFTRVLDNGTREPTVDAPSATIPIPTLAYSDNFGLERWGFGIGVFVPTAYAPKWPETIKVDGNERPAPQRYSILNAEGSAIASLVVGAAFQPVDMLTFGASLVLTSAQVGAEVAVSACDYAVCSQPEGREWQGISRFRLGPVYTATAIAGATISLDRVRIAGSIMLPTRLKGEADFDIALPDQQFFDDVTVENEDGKGDLKADMDVRLPATVRLGLELEPSDALDLEIALTYETWSVQDSVTVRPKNVIVRNVPSIGDVKAQPVELARNMKNTWSVAMGGQYALRNVMPRDRAFGINGGLMFESSAFDDKDLSPTTIDTQKVMLALGASVEVADGVLIDVSYGHLFMRNRKVRDSEVLLPAAIRPLPEDADPDTYDVGDRPAIGNGDYKVEGDFVGLGVRWLIGGPERSAKNAASEETTLETTPAPVVTAPAATEPTPAPAPAPVVPAPTPTPASEPGFVAPAPVVSPSTEGMPAAPAAVPPATPTPASPAPASEQTPAAPAPTAPNNAQMAPAPR